MSTFGERVTGLEAGDGETATKTRDTGKTRLTIKWLYFVPICLNEVS